MRRVHLALLLLAVGIACALLIVSGDDAERSLRDADARRDARETPAMLRGAARIPRADYAKPQAEPPTSGTEEGAARRAPKIVLPVTVRVEGAAEPVSFVPPAVLGFHPVAFRIDSSFDFLSAQTEIVSTGAHELDVGDALRRYVRRRSKRGADFRFDHPGYMPVRVRLPLADAADVVVGRRSLAPLEVMLRPARWVRGKVLDPAGRDLGGVQVLLYLMSADGPDPRPVDEHDTDKSGRFELRYGTDGRYCLVACWAEYSLPGLEVIQRPQPASAVADLHLAEDPAEVVLRLQPSRSVRGRVQVDGTRAVDADIEWSLHGDGRRMSTSVAQAAFDFGGLVYAGGEIHWGWGDADTEADGSFVIRGLSRRPHTLAVRGVGNALIQSKATEQVVKTITPPRDDVLFDIRLARIEALVTLEGAPLKDVEVDVSAVGMEPGMPEGITWATRTLKTTKDGRAGLRVSPAHLYYVFVRDKRYELFFEKVTAPTPGETLVIRAALKPARPRPRLIVTLTGEGAGALECAGFGFYPPDKNRTARTPWPIRSPKPTDGRFTLDDMRPGTYRLHVRPGRLWAWKPNEWAEATQMVEIPESGDAVVAVPVMKGGRLHVTVTDAHGRHLRAGCRIEDSAGTWIRAWFVAEDEMGSSVSAGNALPVVGPSWVEPVLPPGTYALSFTRNGYRSETRRVELKAGEVTAVRVEMKSLR